MMRQTGSSKISRQEARAYDSSLMPQLGQVSLGYEGKPRGGGFGEPRHRGRLSFSRIRVSSSFWEASRVREREEERMRLRHSVTHAHRFARSSELTARAVCSPCACCESHALRWLRPRIGASERNDRSASFVTISGDVRIDCTDCDVGRGFVASVWRMSPIWHVTAVHGNEPIKAPRKQSHTATPHTPQAMLIPDHGTTPTSRRIDKRTHAEELSAFDSSPSSTERVMASGRGMRCVRNGASGADKALADSDPNVVSIVRSTTASAGGNSAPASTFYVTRVPSAMNA